MSLSLGTITNILQRGGFFEQHPSFEIIDGYANDREDIFFVTRTIGRSMPYALWKRSQSSRPRRMVGGALNHDAGHVTLVVADAMRFDELIEIAETLASMDR
jgi:hypothetical protein